ncbi:MAG: hypothetical protein AAF447_00050 [Myxococcota bacterium]
MRSLEDADAARSGDRAAALEAYASLQDAISPRDAERVLWIADQSAPGPPAELDRLFARVLADEGDLVLVRAAYHARALIAWFGGRSDEAEAGWTEAMRLEAAGRDRFWIRSCLNLGMALLARGCLFEPVVLTGMGARAAAAAGQPYLEAYAAFVRATLLLGIDDVSRAEASAAVARLAAAAVEDPGELRVLQYLRFDQSVELLRARGELHAAMAELDRQRAWLEAYGQAEAVVLAEVEGRRLAVQYELEPHARAAIVEALQRLPETHGLGPVWAGDGRREAGALAVRYAVECGSAAVAEREARVLMDDLRAETRASRRVKRAMGLGQLLAKLGPGFETLTRDALALASEACLARIQAAERASRDIPALAEATPHDWQILADFRRRLRDEQAAVLATVAEVLQPGAPAFDLLVRDDMICICAWCSRVRTRADAWLPIAHYVPSAGAFAVTHGMCETCEAIYFAK